MTNQITAMMLAQELEGIYDGLTDAVRSMGSKVKGGGTKNKLSASVIHWFAGSHVRTERDVICDKFIEDVEKQLEMMDMAAQGEPEDDARMAYETATEILTRPVPASSNSTTNLMKRAMSGHARPYLAKISGEKLQQLMQRMKEAYRKSQLLPVEKDLIKEMDKLLTGSPSAK